MKITDCSKQPVKLCGAGCFLQKGEDECKDEIVSSEEEIPNEVCDISPQKNCHPQTKLVPKLVPQRKCVTVPRETCSLSFSNPVPGKKTLLTKWCLDEARQDSIEKRKELKDTPKRNLDIKLSKERELPKLSIDVLERKDMEKVERDIIATKKNQIAAIEKPLEGNTTALGVFNQNGRMDNNKRLSVTPQQSLERIYSLKERGQTYDIKKSKKKGLVKKIKTLLVEDACRTKRMIV